MTLDEFKVTLAGLPPGKAAHVPYDVYETLFAPGEPDDGARNEFAKANGCVIENRPRTAASDGLILQFWQPTATGRRCSTYSGLILANLIT
jgi:hypothetical protein